MPILEDAERRIQQISGYARPKRRDVPALVHSRKPHLFRFKDDGRTPNNPGLPLVLYRTPVRLPSDSDPAAVFGENCSPRRFGRILGGTASTIFCIFTHARMRSSESREAVSD
jgi:hypothetical protein